MEHQKTDLCILIPVYNDWESFFVLHEKIKPLNINNGQVKFCVVDDKSSSIPALPKDVLLIELKRNMGHQKAIAIGLSHLNENTSFEKIIVMDSDGEDRPEDISLLLKKSEAFPGKIIFASRKKRSEGILFKSFYLLYKFIFQLLTGKAIDFGNFSLIPRNKLTSIVNMPETWRHYAGAAVKSKIPIETIFIDKGSRYKGTSKMNFHSLLLHGLSAISVHIETVSIRIFIACIALVGLALLTIGCVTYIRLFTNQATPGWATTIVSGASIIIIQAFFASVVLIFLVLSNQSNNNIIPELDYKKYVLRVRDNA